jgi:2-enoate reductase
MEESEQAIQMLTDAGYDGFDCDNGTYDAWYYAHPPVYMPFNCNLAEAEHIKKFTDKPIGCAGRMQLEDSAKAIAENKLDFVGIARQFLTDDQYLTKIKEEKEEDIIPCISCHTGCLPLARWKDSGCVTNFTEQYGICALNPYTRNEKRYAPHPAAHPRKIAVIGGGVAGMEAALRTAAEGHNVTLYEKSGVLGGVYIAASAESYKENDRKLLAYYRAQLAKSSVHVCMNTEIKDLKQIDADEIIVATGSQKTRELTCYGHEYAVSAVDYLLGRQKVGDNVVIVGGGLTGCEIAYELAKQGKHPAIVEVRNDLIIGPGISMANSHYLKDALIYYRVPEYLESSVKEVRKYAAVVEDKDGNLKEIPADNVIVSMGYIAGNPYADQQDPRVHVIGDANHIGNLRKAIWAANDLAVELSK